MILTALSIIAGYYAADLFVGLYHMATDKGWNIHRQVLAFRAHHDGALVFDLKPVYFALPVLCVGLYFRLPFVASFAFFSGLSEIAHYSSHRPQRCGRLMRKLQRWRVFISPKAHASHHDGVFDRNYCVMSGWANPVVNFVSRFVPQREQP